MNSMIMSKSEAVVLFDLIGVSSIPVGLHDLPDVDEYKYEKIMINFSANKLIDFDSESFRPDKGLDRFLLPILQAKYIMIFNYGEGNKCTFNATLYFAEKGLTAILDDQDDSAVFLTLDSENELMLFIPDLSDTDISLHNGTEPYISYVIILQDGSSVLHSTRINVKMDTARIVEGKRIPSQPPIEAEYEVCLSAYREMLHDKLKEIYDVSCC